MRNPRPLRSQPELSCLGRREEGCEQPTGQEDSSYGGRRRHLLAAAAAPAWFCLPPLALTMLAEPFCLQARHF